MKVYRFLLSFSYCFFGELVREQQGYSYREFGMLLLTLLSIGVYMNKIKDHGQVLINIIKQDLGYNEDAKAIFHRSGMAFLKDLAQRLGYTKSDVDVHSNKGGIAVCGEITLHSDEVYVQLSQFYLSRGHTAILVRTVKDRKDYTGGANHFLPSLALSNPDKLASYIRAHIAVNPKSTRVLDEWQYRVDTAHAMANEAINPQLENTREAFENEDIDLEEFEAAVIGATVKEADQLSLF